VIVRTLTLGVALAVCLSSLPAAAQQLPLAPQFGIQAPTEDLQKLQLPLRAPITLVPTITLSEEYNDNINLDNRNRVWDLVTGISPGLNFLWESRTHRLIAAYNFTAELYLRDPGRDNAFNTQNFTLDGSWRATERLTLTVTDAFNASTDTNLIAPQAASVGGRNRAWGNTLAAGAAYQLDERTTVRGGGSWGTQRFARDELDDSDVYRANAFLDRQLTRTVRGTVGYDFAYFDIEHQDKVQAHTPRIGFTWRATPTITLAALGGPTFELHDDGFSRITPAINASYDQRLWFGSLGFGVDRQLAGSGALGEVTDNTSVYGRVDVITLMRGLTVSFIPRYTWIKSARNDRIDLSQFTAPLFVTYRITAWMAAVARYQFFRQRTDSVIFDRGGNVLATDADQNRLFVGMQFGYPITFDRP